MYHKLLAIRSQDDMPAAGEMSFDELVQRAPLLRAYNRDWKVQGPREWWARRAVWLPFLETAPLSKSDNTEKLHSSKPPPPHFSGHPVQQPLVTLPTHHRERER
jgi:hypothetical protein